MFLPIEQGKQGKESGGFPLKDTLTQSHYYRTARATFGVRVICSMQSLSASVRIPSNLKVVNFDTENGYLWQFSRSKVIKIQYFVKILTSGGELRHLHGCQSVQEQRVSRQHLELRRRPHKSVIGGQSIVQPNLTLDWS